MNTIPKGFTVAPTKWSSKGSKPWPRFPKTRKKNTEYTQISYNLGSKPEQNINKYRFMRAANHKSNIQPAK